MINKALATAALSLSASFVITSCSGSGSSGSASPVSSRASTTPSSGASQSTALERTRFTSKTYGYAAMLPAGWIGIQALQKWDGRTAVTYTSAQVDQLGSGSPGAFGVATPWKRDLAAFTRFLNSPKFLNHSEFCPQQPTTRDRITMGGQPGVLLAYDCGILINIAATVHNGVAYWFVFRDPRVYAANDPTDHATFLKMLRSLRFPQ
jgi:hypothetical protein